MGQERLGIVLTTENTKGFGDGTLRIISHERAMFSAPTPPELNMVINHKFGCL